MQQNYGYDSLNRINWMGEYINGSGATPSGVQGYDYDRWGNRTINVGTWGTGINNKQFTVDAASNRLGVPSGQSGVMQYDANGNLTNDTYTSYGARTFDGENRMLTAWDSSGQQSVYTYDGDGRRVRRKVGVQAEVWQVYGLDGELLAEYSANAAASTPQQEYGYRNGALLITAQASANVQWMVTDQLGTPRIIADRTGSLSGIKRHDYLPFGEELYAGTGNRTTAQGYSVSDGVRQKFTQQERDTETGLDYFGARYYTSVQGRFTSPDNFLNDTSTIDPASWNLYVYVRNNPLFYTDPTGERVYIGNIKNPADRAEFLRRLNFTYGCQGCVTEGADGYLEVDTSNLSQDVIAATAELTEAITTDKFLASAEVVHGDKSIAFGAALNGGTIVPYKGTKAYAVLIKLDFGDDEFLTGDAEAVEVFRNTVFAHEVLHKYRNARSDPKDDTKTGEVVDKVNKIALARGLLLRTRYASTTRAGDYYEVPFGPAKLNNGKVMMKNGNPQIGDNIKFVIWRKENVGGKGIN